MNQHPFPFIGKKLVAAASCAALVVSGSLALAGCQMETEMDSSLTPTVESGSTITDGTLTVGVNAANTPYGGTNSDNETIGLDVDLAAAIADELGLELQIVDVSSNGRSALAEGQVDLVMGATKSGSDDTVTYSSAYINDGASLYCLEGNEPESVSDVELGKKDKIIVQGGTNASSEVQAVVGVDYIEASSTMQEAFDSLVAGDQTYLVADAVIGDYFARNYEDVVRVGFIGADCVSPMYAITLTENYELTSAVSEAITTIADDGRLRVIEAKWLGSEGEALLPGQEEEESMPETAFGL